MTINNTETFENFWATFTWPEPVEVFYRLYYDSDGWPICYSMEDLPHAYVDITKEIFAIADSKVRVVDGKVESIKASLVALKLRPSETGAICDTRDVCVVTTIDRPHIKWNIPL